MPARKAAPKDKPGRVKAGECASQQRLGSPLPDRLAGKGAMPATVQDVTAGAEQAPIDGQRVRRLEHELKAAREALQRTLEELEASKGTLRSLNEALDPHSFPSGHATRAVMLAVLALSLGPAWFGILVAIWAPLVCLSRVMTGVHYISDILGGMMLGLVMGVVLVGLSSMWPVIFPFLFSG